MPMCCTLCIVMDLRKFCSRKRAAHTTEGESSSEPMCKIQAVQISDQESQASCAPLKKKLTKAENLILNFYRKATTKIHKQTVKYIK